MRNIASAGIVAIAIAIAIASAACGGQVSPVDVDAPVGVDDRGVGASVSVEQLAGEPVVDEEGNLRSEYAGVLTSIGEYDPPSIDDVRDLIEFSDAVVVGRSGSRSQFYDGEPEEGFVYTSQKFDLVETIKGQVTDPFRISIVGGAHLERDGEIYLLESHRNPQFRPHAEYLLFLREQPKEAYGDHWWTMGPWLGRYGVEDGVVSTLFDDDLLADDEEFAGREGHRESEHDELDLLGTPLHEVREAAQSAAN